MRGAFIAVITGFSPLQREATQSPGARRHGAQHIEAGLLPRVHRDPVMKPHSLVLIGAGRIAASMPAPLPVLPGEVAAVVDPDPSAGAEVAALHGGEAFATWRMRSSEAQLQESSSPRQRELTRITLKPAFPADPVLCEKPVDLTLARVDQCLDRINRSDVPVTIGFHRRADPRAVK